MGGPRPVPSSAPEQHSALARSAAPPRLRAGGVLAPFLVSRVISDGLIALVAVVNGRGAVSGAFSRWDGRWYVWIARHGYVGAPPLTQHHQTPWPFFPLLPGAMRGVHLVSGLPIPIAGIVLNHVAFFVALVGVQRIARRHVPPGAATLAVWVAALAPFAFMFSMIYPSALFLAASVWAFLLVEEDRDTMAGAAAAVAALTRPDGIIVAVVLFFVVRFEWERAARVCWPPVIALSAWILFNAERTGDALRFLHAKGAWHEIDLVTLVERPASSSNAVAHLLIAVVAFLVVVMAGRAIPRAWTWFTGLYLLPSLLLGIVGMGRYASDAFPPAIAAGSLLERRSRAVLVAVATVLVGLQAVAVFVYVGQHATP
jgi:hypothetical protein